MKDAYVLYKMSLKLCDDLIATLNHKSFSYNAAVTNISIYNKIILNLKEAFPNSEIVRTFQQTPQFKEYIRRNDNYRYKFIQLISMTGQITSFLEATLDDPIRKMEILSDEIKSLKEKNSELEKINILNSENLNKYIKAEEFPVSEEISSKVPKELLPTLQDALRAYGAGSYTACVCVCRNIIQGLVEEQCVQEGIKENGLKKKIDALISNKNIKQKHNQTLLDTVATLGHRSAHPTTEVFKKEKASLVLNGLLILIDEVFT
ncbi:MAG: DUF4145 domain-containing protein [Anaerolineales bacterium]|nr:DUF4145 domain-containing protein [Anaerolineales bacterium]